MLRERGRVAGLSRSRTDDDPEYTSARQNLAALRLEQHVRDALAKAPRPTDAQLQRIAAILLSGGAS
jgi:hypothetical protein